MAEAIRHRGPDDSGVWCDERHGIALSHRRLSIIDLSPAGHQPMTSPSGRYVISYNGEVFNFAELRKELAELGMQFRGNSDTEVILAAIDRWGVVAATERFIGMFAFALWDRQEAELILVRDRLGIKPVYWGEVSGAFVFASEPGAFAQVTGWTGAVDPAALTAYLRWNYVPAPHCIFQGIAKLPPGSLLRRKAGGAVRVEKYWRLREVASDGVATPVDLSDEEATERFEALLRDAVGRRMVSDVPLGAFLSGGIDSSLVVALMQAQSKRPVKTFTIGFNEQFFNEAEHAKAVAAHLGTDHHELYLKPNEAMEVIPSLPGIYAEPFADSSQIPTFLVSHMTRRDVTVALSGDGGDELMAGYTRYRWADMTHRRFDRWPQRLRHAAASGLSSVPEAAWAIAGQLLPERVSKGRLADRAGRFGWFLAQPDADAIYRRQHCQWPDPAAITGSSAEAPTALEEPGLKDDFRHFVTRMQVMDSLTYLPDDVLTKVDRASMAVSLEVRVPLLDHRLVEFGWRLPYEQKYRDGQAKWLLRRVLDRYVPEQLIDRPKSGFGIPIAQWLRGPLRAWAEELLRPNSLAGAGLPGHQPIHRAWQLLQSGHNRFQEPIWGILMYRAWHANQQSAVGNAAKTLQNSKRASIVVGDEGEKGQLL